MQILRLLENSQIKECKKSELENSGIQNFVAGCSTRLELVYLSRELKADRFSSACAIHR